MARKILAAVQVKSAEVSEKSGTGKNGRPYTIREQTVWIDLGEAYPEKMTVRLEDRDPPYSPGEYVITDECLYLDKYNSLSVGRVKLVPKAAGAIAGIKG